MLTLVGERFARPGATFEYLGPVPACAPCKLKPVCHNKELQAHRAYEVVAARDVHHPCPADFFDGGMRVAEVKPLPVEGTIPASAVRGTAVTHRFEECGAACLFRRHCDTPALPPGTDCAIAGVGEPVACKVGRELRFARLEPRRGRS